MPHNKYNDHIVEKIKADSCNKRIEKKEFDKVIVASFFNDGVFVLADINDKDRKVYSNYCKRTTLVKGADQSYISKELIKLPQRSKIRFEETESGYKF